MRMRKKKNLEARLSRVSERLVTDPHACKRHWSELSGGRPVLLEIGCGKGRFAAGTAKALPDAFVVAAEIEENVLVMAMEAADAAGAENLRFIHTDAEALGAYFAPGEVSRIYLNFSDPWPKSPSRRLTGERFLELYESLLAEGGELRFKSDNRYLFDWSEEELRRLGWRIEDITHDLHTSGLDGGVMTEYEERFSSMGTPINYLRALPPEIRREPKTDLLPVTSPEEIERVARLAEQIWREHFTPLIGRAQVAYMLDKFQSVHAITEQIASGYEYRLLTVDGEDAGYIGTHREEERMFLSKLYVARRYRGRGYAGLMLDDLIRRSEGLRSIYLTCNKHNDGSLAVYRARGFEVIDSVVTDIGGGFVMDDYIFELKLPGRDDK